MTYLLNFYQVLKVQKNPINNYKIFNTLKVFYPFAVVQLPEYKKPLVFHSFDLKYFTDCTSV